MLETRNDVMAFESSWAITCEALLGMMLRGKREANYFDVKRGESLLHIWRRLKSVGELSGEREVRVHS